MTALFVLFWRWNGAGGLCFEGDNRQKEFTTSRHFTFTSILIPAVRFDKWRSADLLTEINGLIAGRSFEDPQTAADELPVQTIILHYQDDRLLTLRAKIAQLP